jgi:hypothetical protein
MAARIQSRAMLSSLSRSSGVSACAASCTQSRAKASNSFAAEPDDMGSRLHGAPSSTVALSSLEFQGVPSNPASSLCELRAALGDYQGVGALRARLWAAASIGTTPARGSRRRGVAGALWGATSGPRRPVRKADLEFPVRRSVQPAARIRARKACTPRRSPWRRSCECRRRRERLSLNHRRA